MQDNELLGGEKMDLTMLHILSAVCAYLLVSLNPAIILSKAIYKKDIRECGSGNPGFTNFKRTFGHRWAWWVFALDLTKTAVVVAVFAYIFHISGSSYQYGAAYTGLFCMLGHTLPVWYGLKGGKGFLVLFSVVWFISWKAGFMAAAVWTLLFFTLKYMSLATMVAMAAALVCLLFHHVDTPLVLWLYGAEVLILVVRHRENIGRLLHGTEKKFSFK